MAKYLRFSLIIVFACFFLLSFVKPVVAENSNVILEFYYTEGCDFCEEKAPVINQLEIYYASNITVHRLSVSVTQNKNKFDIYGFTSTPGVVVKNESNGNYSTFTYDFITFENLKNSIDYHLIGNYSKEPPKPIDESTFCFFGLFCINTSELSLPALTLTLAFLDSFNPCSFFILLFLLNLLLYVQSRKRMLLIGCIFIFFSGFIYFLLMASLTSVFLIVNQQLIIMLMAGAVALVLGLFNIKDFFFFRHGPSASIPDDKKPKLFEQMRKIVQVSYLPSMVIATIVLAIFANTYELLCTLGFPTIYIAELTSYNLSSVQYYTYLAIYNIIYVIPLIVILLIFVVKLGGKKLTEWQGRVLKLVSGIMMFSLGIVLLIKPDLLKNPIASIGIIALSVIISLILSRVVKKTISQNGKFN
jgi:hypothetical protein